MGGATNAHPLQRKDTDESQAMRLACSQREMTLILGFFWHLSLILYSF